MMAFGRHGPPSGHKVVDLLLRMRTALDVHGRAVDDGASGAGGLDAHVEHGCRLDDIRFQG